MSAYCLYFLFAMFAPTLVDVFCWFLQISAETAKLDPDPLKPIKLLITTRMTHKLELKIQTMDKVQMKEQILKHGC